MDINVTNTMRYAERQKIEKSHIGDRQSVFGATFLFTRYRTYQSITSAA